MPASSFDRLMKRCAARFSPRRQGVQVLYLRNVQGHRRRRYQIDGIFDCDYEAVNLDSDGVPVSSRRTQLSIHKDAIPFTPKRGDKVQVGKEEFVIADYEPDSEFGIALILRK